MVFVRGVLSGYDIGVVIIFEIVRKSSGWTKRPTAAHHRGSMTGQWIAHLTGRWEGVQWVTPWGETYASRLDTGRIDASLHDFLMGLRGGERKEGWAVWVPEEWRGQPAGIAEGVFRTLCFRNPNGTELALEFHYKPAPAALLAVLEALTWDLPAIAGQPTPPAAVGDTGGDDDGTEEQALRKLRHPAVPAERGHSAAVGAGVGDAEAAEGEERVRRVAAREARHDRGPEGRRLTWRSTPS
jgi:hypothetical protein